MVDLKDIIKKMNIDELKKLYEELKEDKIHVETILKNKIEETEKENQKICAVCGRKISEVKEPFVLYFGPRDLRQKAYFCGVDCLEYFLKNMKTSKGKITQKDNKQVIRKTKVTKKSPFKKIIQAIANAFE
ncbi:MAG: hypothetical protein GWP09_02260 [Nitrospiraceae bacterium]|nr:hypothetical protein [Nitrospiraceae bacterium]